MFTASKTIPMVPGLPVVGSLLAMRKDRVGFMLGVIREYGDIAQMRISTRPVVVIGSAELAGEVLVEKDESFVKAPGLRIFGRPLFGNGLLTSEHGFHKRQRRMMSPMFMHKRIAGFAQVMAERAEERQASWKDGETIDLSAEMMRMTLEVVGKTLFGAEVGSEAEEIGHALTVCMESIIGQLNSLLPMPPQLPTPSNLRFRKSIARLDETIYRLIRERRASGQDRGDLLSMLLTAQDEDDGSVMDDKQVRDELMTIFLAGHETTANALAWTHYLLGQHPHVYHRLQREVDEVLAGRTPTLEDMPRLPYTLQVFKESMRLYPPAYVMGRTAERDVRIGGHDIKAGSIVVISILGIHHREKYFPDPERFDPTRFTPEREKALPRHAFMPFGAGPRICIGNHFALMEGQLMLAAITQRARLELPPGFRVEPEPLITLRPKGGIPMRVRRRARAVRDEVVAAIA